MDPLFQPLIQLGFAGFSVILVGVIIWLVKRLLEILDKTNKVIAANTSTIQALHVELTDQNRLLREVRSELQRRPCLRPKD